MEGNDERVAAAPAGLQRAPSGSTLVLAIPALTGPDAHTLGRVFEDRDSTLLGWP